jgi:hypothetical protein
VNHDENVRPTGDQHLQDLREVEQLVADVMDALACT